MKMDMDLDDIGNTENAAKIDGRIRDTIDKMRVSVLSVSLDLANIKAKGLFDSLGFKFMSQYVTKLCDDTQMDRSGINKWIRIGLAYIKYRDDLEKAGFTENSGPIKLLYLEKALINHDKNEVFSELINLSVRKFIAYSGKTRENADKIKPVVQIRGGGIYANGDLVARINRKTSKRILMYLGRVISMAGRAMEEDGYILPERRRGLARAEMIERQSPDLTPKMRKNA